MSLSFLFSRLDFQSKAMKIWGCQSETHQLQDKSQWQEKSFLHWHFEIQTHRLSTYFEWLKAHTNTHTHTNTGGLTIALLVVASRCRDRTGVLKFVTILTSQSRSDQKGRSRRLFWIHPSIFFVSLTLCGMCMCVCVWRGAEVWLLTRSTSSVFDLWPHLPSEMVNGGFASQVDRASTHRSVGWSIKSCMCSNTSARPSFVCLPHWRDEDVDEVVENLSTGYKRDEQNDHEDEDDFLCTHLFRCVAWLKRPGLTGTLV